MNMLNGAYMVEARGMIESLYTAPEVKLEIFDKLWKHITDLQHGYESEYHNGYSAGHKEGYEQGKRDAVKQAYWKPTGYDDQDEYQYECSHCGMGVTAFFSDNELHLPDFCEHCGSKMDAQEGAEK